MIISVWKNKYWLSVRLINGGNNMSERFVLNETSIFGRGCRSELPGEIKGRGYKKVFLVSD